MLKSLRLRVSTWAGLAPLALAGLPASVGHQIANEQLLNPRCFWLDYPVPSTAACEPTFVPGVDRYLWIDRYWRGPTWLFSTWFILRGLLNLGYEAEAAKIQDAYLAGRKDEATAAVPDKLIDETALVGPADRIKDRLQAWKQGAAGNKIGTMLLNVSDVATMRVIAEAVA